MNNENLHSLLTLPSPQLPFLMAETAPSTLPGVLASPEGGVLHSDGLLRAHPSLLITSGLVPRIRYQQSLEREMQTLLWEEMPT